MKPQRIKSLFFYPITGLTLFLFLTTAFSSCASTSVAQTIIKTPTLRPTFTATATAAPAQLTLEQSIRAYISSMPLNDKIGQLLVLQFITDGYYGDSVTMMQNYQPGGLILYHFEIPNQSSITSMTSAAQKDAHIPMLIMADQEGGFIDQLYPIFGHTSTATLIGLTHNPQYAYQQGAMEAEHLKEVGFNTNLAPDVDVETVHGPDQATRTFGYNAPDVVTMAGAFLDGLQQNGVIGTLKHFPGLGASNVDAHLGLPVINETKSQIESIDLQPYRDLLNSYDPPGMIMTTDLLMPAIDPNLPAEISPAIITGLLRDQLHYNGVIITDALYMRGVLEKTQDMYQAGVLALKAGCDMLLGPSTSYTALMMVNAIKDAIHSGVLTMANIDQSVYRVLMLKAQKLGWRPPKTSQPASTPSPTAPYFSFGPMDVWQNAI